MKIRSGPAIPPTATDNAGTDGSLTDPRVVSFSPYVRPCIVMNGTGNGNDILIKINVDNTNDFDNDSDDDGPGYYAVADGETVDVSLLGMISVDRVSFVTLDGGDDLDKVAVVGWEP